LIEIPQIGFDAQSLTGTVQTGLGMYARGIARALEKKRELISLELLWPKDRKPFSATGERILWEMFNLPSKAKAAKSDLIHLPCFGVPRLTSIPRVVTAHDLIILKHPDMMPPGSRWYFSYWIPQSYRSADHIIAVSDCTKNDLVEYLNIKPEKITVVHHGIDQSFFNVPAVENIASVKDRYGIFERFFMMVGSFERRKNVELAIDAFSILAKDHEEVQLVLVGSSSEYRERMIEKANDYGLEDRIIFTGYLQDRDVATLYSICTAFLFPSSHEGFGLPLLEAMAAGAPVIASDIRVLKEIGGDAPCYVQEGKIEALMGSMERMLVDENIREECRVRGRSRAELFSWDDAADKTIEVYMNVLGMRGFDGIPARVT
jgi:glycosyltransferase involved in cell wall biosynthesis